MRRFRRLRQTEEMRSFVRETRIGREDLIYPVFVQEGRDIREPVPSMPGVFRYSIDRLDEILARIKSLGIPAILLFGIPGHKDERGSGAYDPEGITQRAIRFIKEKMPSLLVIADICLCEYTSHGHCGLVGDGQVLNDETLPLLARAAVTNADAGADIIAPSDMMDGRVAAIRKALNEEGHKNVPVLSYSAKYASGYYGPFRDAAESAPLFGDRRSYQMDPANARQAGEEMEDDLEEGADMLIVKPALAYLDILKMARDRFAVPVIAYNVSGEYSMVKAAARMGWIEEKRIVMENMIAMKRAGADRIITYHALDVAGWLSEG
ncbi:MAG: porphobilinogen synthase [Lachnospiraceae bacterium]|jgi:porphobilinogen synthase|nr:porphobilinogen synthase [Lachnospiraceae bacterium]